MLARFENGYFLEVGIDEEENEYGYSVYDENGDEVDSGHTEYRDLSMYYPMNLIDYILEYCEPYDTNGKYVLLEQESMYDYLEKYGEDPNGEWILERQGEENDIRRYSSFEVAQHVMNLEYGEILNSYSSCMLEDLDKDYAMVGNDECYQSWKIYKEKTFENPIESKFNEIKMELDRTDIGVSHYAFKLTDTDVIYDHLYKVGQLIDELKEMI